MTEPEHIAAIFAKDPEAWGRAEIMKAISSDNERERNQRF